MPAFPRRHFRAALLLVLTGGPGLALAQAGPGLTPAGGVSPEPLTWFDVFGTSVRADVDNSNSTEGEDSRIGIGGAAHVSFGNRYQPVRFFAEGSIQRNEFDTLNVDLDQYRIGPGIEFGLPRERQGVNAPRFFAIAEFIDWDIGTHARGGGARVGVRKPFAGVAAAYAEAGFLRLDAQHSDQYLVGPELKAGFDVVPTPDLAQNARIFVEYRYTGTRLHGGAGTTDFTLNDIRAGVRIGFGNYRSP